MTDADAMRFLRDARLDERLIEGLEALEESSWEALVRVGESVGLSFTVAELQRAYAQDWGLRMARYGAE